MDATALLVHILSQTRQNVEFLISQKQISHDVGREILAKIPSKPTSPEAALIHQTQNLSISSPAPAVHPISLHGPGNSYSSPPYQPPPAPALPPGVLFRAKALWDYNENNQNPGDLPFRVGDIVDVVVETNKDWWTGRLNGKTAVFPSNYVERLPNPQAAAPPRAHSPPPSGPQYGATSSYSSYSSPGGYPPPSANYPPTGGPGYAPPSGYGPPSGYNGPPPPSQAYTPYGGPPPTKETAIRDEQQAPQKKSKFGGLGDTLATAAVGGVGFGAGSAIGSGIIDSIF